MGNSAKKWMAIGAAAFVIVILAAYLLAQKKVQNFNDKYAGEDLAAEVAGMEREGTYSKYLSERQGAPCPKEDVEVDLFAFAAEGEAEEITDYEGEQKALYTGADSVVTWEVFAPEGGFYNLYMEYFAPESRGVAVERAIRINGELPFEDAKNVAFPRIWHDGGEVRVDNQGNEIRPTQVESYEWQGAYFKDDMGYITEPYLFYLEKGKNTLTLEAENEPAVLRRLAFTAVREIVPYDAYLAAQPAVSETTEGKNYLQIVQGEDSTYRSESSLYAKYDRSSPSTQPNSVTKTVLNYVGGEAWRSPGQWIEWEFSVPEDGFYHIMVKGRQNYSRGNVSGRMVSIDGEVPFAEMKGIFFDYSNGWNCMNLADADGNPYQFYLTAGAHTIRLEATLGGVGAILEELEDSIYRLNQIYRKILVYTGANPDKYRDYNVHQVYPEVMDAMDLESKRLYKIVDDMVDYSGQKADSIASAQTVAQQLERFVKKPQQITLEFTTFRDNITALGSASLNMSATMLDVDYLAIMGENATAPKDTEPWFARAWHEVKSFAASFVVDYDAVGDVYEDTGEVVKVWVLTGRDQGTILKSMIDDTFTPDTGVRVNVEVVAPDALLNAVVAGRGPNVVISVGADQPVNYALRNAAEDLTQFADLQEVLSHYEESSYEQYRLDDQIYAIPETQTFNVMFYRKDVLEELGLSVPNTWQELIEMLPTIQGNNMSVAIPTAAGNSATSTPSTSVASNAPDLSMYFCLLFQYGGNLYNDAGTMTTVNDEAGVKAFDDYTRYFNDYGIPTIYDFVSRFRSGEMPIGVMAYSTYNTLMVSAPEIRGLWDFTLIPGTERTGEDGKPYIDRSDMITGSATMMVRTEDDALREKSWEFMKWWAKTDTQVRFGREIEALLGSSARYATANKDAFSKLSWSADDIKTLTAQWEQTVGIREVPGGYYTGRHITNAIRKVINDKDDPRETIIDYSITIDEEITKKRIEFGLPTAKDAAGA